MIRCYTLRLYGSLRIASGPWFWFRPRDPPQLVGRVPRSANLSPTPADRTVLIPVGTTSSKLRNPRTQNRSADSSVGGGRVTRRRWFRHLVVAACSGALVWFFWNTRSNWTGDMRLWKAVGDASYILLLAALTLGPLSRLVPSTRGWLRWRRQIGIWFALTASLHGILILNGWARWSLRRFLGYPDSGSPI